MAALERAVGEQARGWMGVDMILGPREDGRLDRVLEINPRLMTSFLGHAAASGTSLLGWLTGPPTVLPPRPLGPLSFDLVADAHT